VVIIGPPGWVQGPEASGAKAMTRKKMPKPPRCLLLGDRQRDIWNAYCGSVSSPQLWDDDKIARQRWHFAIHKALTHRGMTSASAESCRWMIDTAVSARIGLGTSIVEALARQLQARVQIVDRYPGRLGLTNAIVADR
jgi:hypothetical protein